MEQISENKKLPFEEETYKLFVQMRKSANISRGYVYDENDIYQHSEDFRKGFLVGARLAAILLKNEEIY